MIKVEAINLVKKYGQTIAVDRATITANKGEFVTILGPSGCGKSTTLRMIAGLITPDEGKILFDGKDVTRHPAR
jgi:ABC-type sugar transport system ATPase subunit